MAKSMKWGEEEDGLAHSGDKRPELRAKAARELERLKWFLPHGNVVRALETVEGVEDLVAATEESGGSRKLEKVVAEFRKYIQNNAHLIPNGGERRRTGERISTSTAKSTVNQVISKKIVKKQQMRWSGRGAHLLLQSADARAEW